MFYKTEIQPALHDVAGAVGGTEEDQAPLLLVERDPLLEPNIQKGKTSRTKP